MHIHEHYLVQQNKDALVSQNRIRMIRARASLVAMVARASLVAMVARASLVAMVARASWVAVHVVIGLGMLIPLLL